MLNKLFSLFLISNLIFGLNTLVCSQTRLTYSIDIEPINSYRKYVLKDCNAYPTFSKKDFISYFNNYYDSIESPKIGWGFSFGIEYELNNKFQIKTGLNYKNIGEKTEYIRPSAYYIINNVQIPFYQNTSDNYYINNTYTYVSLPINIQYNIFNYKKLSLGILIGNDFDFLLKSFITKHSINNGFNDIKSEYGKVSNFACNIHSSIELNYAINEKLSFYIQPEYAKYITPNVKYNIILSDGLYYYNVNQYNYYQQIKFGVKLKI